MGSSQSTSTPENPDEIKVNPWDTSAVKNALDDAAKEVAKETLHFKEVHALMNTRLAISFIAISFAGFALIYDYKEPFPKSKFVLATCSISYFIMMGIFTLFTLLKEKNIIFEGDDLETVVGVPARLSLATTLKKYQSNFEFTMKILNGDNKEEVFFEFPIEDYFTQDGLLLKKKFEGFITSKFEKIAHVRKGEAKKTK